MFIQPSPPPKEPTPEPSEPPSRELSFVRIQSPPELPPIEVPALPDIPEKQAVSDVCLAYIVWC